MASINSVMGLAWTVVGNNLLPFVPYTSIGAIDADQSSRIPTEPIEKGQLAAYNIVREPERVNVEFYFNGTYAVQVLALAMLDKKINSTETCTIFSPAKRNLCSFTILLLFFSSFFFPIFFLQFRRRGRGT